MNGGKPHPITRFAQDGASFSINTDDPTVTNTNLSDEYVLCAQWGLTLAQLQKSVSHGLNLEDKQ
jgi:adenosine deaminase